MVVSIYYRAVMDLRVEIEPKNIGFTGHLSNYRKLCKGVSKKDVEEIQFDISDLFHPLSARQYSSSLQIKFGMFQILKTWRGN